MKRNFNADEWYVWEQNSSPMLQVLTLTPTYKHLREYMGSCLFNSLLIFESDDNGNYQCKWLFRFEEGKALGQKMVDMLMCTPYKNTFDRQIEIARNNLINKAKEIQAFTEIEKADNETIVNTFEELCNLFYEFYKLGQFTEPLQWQSESIITKYIKANFEKEADSILRSLFTTKEKLFAIEILEDLKDISQKHGEELQERCKEHSDKYYWKRNNYFSTMYVTSEDVLKELENAKAVKIESKDELLKEKEQVYSQLPAYYKGIVDLCNMSAIMGDTRKSAVMIANSAFDKLLKVIADRNNVTMEEIRLLIPQELKYFVEAPEEYKERLETRKKKFMVYQSDFAMVDDLIEIPSNDNEVKSWNVSHMDEPFIAEGEEVENIINELDVRLNLLKHNAGEKETLKGVTTFYNKEQRELTGVVKVIKNPKTEKLEENEILVAPSTTPDYIDSIHKSIAIITDYGGQTSHAAIVSREMKKPCIIGTNFASSILKNGDKIRIDFEKGTIEIVK